VSTHADGSVSVRGHLDAVGGEKVQAALEAHVQADRPAGDERTRAQRQGDALVQLADTALATGAVPVLRTVRPHVVVRIDLDDLDDLADTSTGTGTATLGSGR
jgi:anti-anti-sigma regulatory factor